MTLQVVHIEGDQPLSEALRFAFEAVIPDAIIQQFTNADAALPYIEANCSDIDLFVFDIHISGTLNGLDMAQRIRDLGCPGAIALTSSSVRPGQQMLTSLRAEFYPKPWHIYDIAPKLGQYRMKRSSDSE